MLSLWASLLPLAIASAVVPVQLIVTVLLGQSAGGRTASLAWVAGMLTVRLTQGVVLGLVLGPEIWGGGEDAGVAASLGLLVVATLLLVMAARKALDEPDEDAPPPRWKAGLDSATPARAYLMGVGVLLISAKSWVFTLGAVAAIEAAEGGPGSSVLAYVVFVLLAMSAHLAIVGSAYLAPQRADRLLGSFADALGRYDRPITIAVGVIFGAWFLLRALDGLGLI